MENQQNRLIHEIDVEQRLLGCVIDRPDSIIKVISAVKPEWFNMSNTRAVWLAIVKLFKQNKDLTIARIINIAKVDRGWLVNLWEWGNWSQDDLKFYTEKLEECYIIRQLRNTSRDIIEATEKADIDLSEYLNQLAESIIQLGISDELKFYTLKESYDRATDLTKKAAKGDYAGIKTGYSDIDNIISGFYPGELTIIAGLTSIGKTSFALNIADDISIIKNIPVLFVSLEMNDVALVRRLVCAKSSILKTYNLKNGRLTDMQEEDWKNKGRIVSDGKIYIVEKNNMNVLDLAAVIKMAILKFKIRAVFIDYLQIMSGGKKFQSDTSEVSFVSRSLKQLAIDYKLPIIALSQLRRFEQERAPKLTDLKQSGSIEQDADIVIFIHRKKEEDKEFYENKTSVIIAKQRDGETGTVNMMFTPERTRFELMVKDPSGWE